MVRIHEANGVVSEIFKRHTVQAIETLGLRGLGWSSSDRVRVDARTDSVLSVKAEMVVLSIRTFVYAEEIGKLVAEYPKDWWQAVRERWCPKWAKDRWPIQKTKIVVDVNATWPDWEPPVSPTGEMVVKVLERTYDIPEDEDYLS